MAATRAQRALDVLAAEHGLRGARRGDDDVGALELLLDALERQRRAAELLGELGCAIERAVRDDRDLGAARDEAPGGLLAHLARAHEQDAAALELAEDLLGERGGGCGHRGGR